MPSRGSRDDRRRPRSVGMGAGPPAGRPPRLEELYRAADRSRRARPRRAGDPVLRRWRALAVRRPDDGRDGLHERRLDVGRLPGLEGRRARLRDAGRPEPGAEAPLQPPPADPRSRRRRPGQAPRFEGAADRRGRARVAGVAVPRRRGRRHDRDRRLRRRRRQQPPAPDPAHDRSGGGAQDRIREALDQRAQPRGQRRRPRGDARRRERRADHQGLRRHPRRHRHVRDPLHPQRRGRRGGHPGRPRAACSASRAS